MEFLTKQRHHSAATNGRWNTQQTSHDIPLLPQHYYDEVKDKQGNPIEDLQATLAAFINSNDKELIITIRNYQHTTRNRIIKKDTK